MASILTDVTNIPNTIQNDNMMFPMDLKPSPITIPPAPSTSSMPLASPVTRAYSSDQPSASSMPLASPMHRAYSSHQTSASSMPSASHMTKEEEERTKQMYKLAKLLGDLDKEDKQKDKIKVEQAEHKTIKEIEDELQGHPLRGINFGPGPAWKMENRRNYYYQWNPSKYSKWDPELAKTKKQIEKEDALKEYENMGGKRYSRKNIKKRRRKTKKNKKRKTKRRQRKGKKKSRKR